MLLESEKIGTKMRNLLNKSKKENQTLIKISDFGKFIKTLGLSFKEYDIA
jgi:hypothetical protein